MGRLLHLGCHVLRPNLHPIADPWVSLATVALNTERMRIGTMITLIARRRPWKLARKTVSVDQLSNGRLTLGVGLGDPSQWDFGFFDKVTDPKVRATRLDEGLDILTGLWAAQPFSYQGKQYNIKEVTFRPTSVQSSCIPIWVGGWFSNKPPLRRAARWDGVCPLKWGGSITPDDGENFWHTFNNIAPVPRPSMPSIQAQHLAIT